MTTRPASVFPEATPRLAGIPNEGHRLHLVVDADHYWFPASPQERSKFAGFLQRHQDIELTLVTGQPAWNACTTLNQIPGGLLRHLVAGHGEEILHVTEGGEWNPDLEFEMWKHLLGNPQDDLAPRQVSPQVVAIEYLECNCACPRPLFACLGSVDWQSLLGLADCVCLPKSWAGLASSPTESSFLVEPSLKGLLRVLESRKPFQRTQTGVSRHHVHAH